MSIILLFDELFITLLRSKVRAHDLAGVDSKVRLLWYVARVLDGLLARRVAGRFLEIQQPWPKPAAPAGGAVQQVARTVSLTDLVDEVGGASVRPYLA